MILHSYYDLDPQIYDDQFWWKKDDIEFWKKELSNDGIKVLELGCGTGRIASGLIDNKLHYIGMDVSSEYITYATAKFKHFPNISFIQGNMIDFNLEHTFDYIFIGFNTFLHLLTNDQAKQCFQCVKSHLSDGGIFILDIVHPHPSFLSKNDNASELVMDFKDSEHDDIVQIYEKCKYDNATEICDIVWEYRYKKHLEYSKQFEYQMRMYYPDTMNRLLTESGFYIEDMYGDYDMNPFKENSHLQIYKAK